MDNEIFNGDDLYTLENATHVTHDTDLSKCTIHFEMLVGRKWNVITKEEEQVTVFGSIVQASFDKKNVGRTIPMAATNFHTANIPDTTNNGSVGMNRFHKMGNDEKMAIQVNMKAVPLDYSSMTALRAAQFQRVIETAIGKHSSICPMDKKRCQRVVKRVDNLSQLWSGYKIRSAKTPEKKAAYMYQMYRKGKLKVFVPLIPVEVTPVKGDIDEVEGDVPETLQATLIHTGSCIAVRLDSFAQTSITYSTSENIPLAQAVSPSSSAKPKRDLATSSSNRA